MAILAGSSSYKGRPHGLMGKSSDGSVYVVATYSLVAAVVLLLLGGFFGHSQYRKLSEELTRVAKEAELQKHVSLDARLQLDDARRARENLQTANDDIRREKDRELSHSASRIQQLEARVEHLTSQLSGKETEHGELATSYQVSNQRLAADLSKCKSEIQHMQHETSVLKSLLDEKTSAIDHLDRNLRLERETTARLYQERVQQQHQQQQQQRVPYPSEGPSGGGAAPVHSHGPGPSPAAAGGHGGDARGPVPDHGAPVHQHDRAVPQHQPQHGAPQHQQEPYVVNDLAGHRDERQAAEDVRAHGREYFDDAAEADDVNTLAARHADLQARRRESNLKRLAAERQGEDVSMDHRYAHLHTGREVHV